MLTELIQLLKYRTVTTQFVVKRQSEEMTFFVYVLL